MKREIKFRAWNGSKMRYKVNINQGKAVRYGYQWFGDGNDIHNSEPMQYTGLKDKNGKEIYEGDIVEWIVKPKYGKEYIHVHTIDFDIETEGGFGDSYTNGYTYCFNPLECKVIGNIHENSELA